MPNDPSVKIATAAVNCLLDWQRDTGQNMTLEQFRAYAKTTPEIHFFIRGWELGGKRLTFILGDRQN